jgi:SAM-dependent methyltransferase/uncharacterized protein YbaR (Trm112 family)
VTADAELPGSLVCPVEGLPLQREGMRLVSPGGRAYPLVEGIPVLLVGDVQQTIGIARASLAAAKKAMEGSTLTHDDVLLTLGISDEERAHARAQMSEGGRRSVNPFISALVGATSGYAYKDVIGRLERVPIPRIPPHIDRQLGQTVLDVGCNWGRWSMAAGAHEGRTVVGLDPSLGAVMAARGIARERGVDFRGVVADARYMPFAAASFDGIISYSVLQHFSRPDLQLAIAECRRVLGNTGIAAIQMASRNGIRSLFHLARRGFRSGSTFDVRYWSPGELKGMFSAIGEARLSVDCYFGLGLQATDIDLATGTGRHAIRASEWLKRHFGVDGAPTLFADSLWVLSRATDRSIH